MIELRLPPQALDAEKNLISFALSDKPESAEHVCKHILPQQFYSNKNMLIMQCIMDSVEDYPSLADIMTVTKRLRDKNLLEEAGGTEYLASIIDTLPMDQDKIGSEAIKVKEAYERRKLIELSNKIIDMAQNSVEDIESIIDMINEKLSHIVASNTDYRAELVMDFRKEV